MLDTLRLALVGLAVAGPAWAEKPPVRVPGLWETATITDAGRTVARECVDERTDRLVKQATAGLSTCRNDDFKRANEGLAAGAICRSGGVTTDNRVTVTGDFATFARVEAVSTVTGLAGVAGPRAFRSAIEARRLGDCAPDQRPGDVILPDGTVINVPPAAR